MPQKCVSDCQQPGLTLANDPVTSEPFDWTGSPIGTRQCAPHASAVEYVDPENDTASGPDLSHTTPSSCTVYPHEATSASCGGDTSTAIPSPALSMMAVSVPCADTAVATITKRASAIAMVPRRLFFYCVNRIFSNCVNLFPFAPNQRSFRAEEGPTRSTPFSLFSGHVASLAQSSSVTSSDPLGHASHFEISECALRRVKVKVKGCRREEDWSYTSELAARDQLRSCNRQFGVRVLLRSFLILVKPLDEIVHTD